MELYLRKLRCIAHKFHLANSKTLHKLTFWYDFWLTFHLRILINCPFWSPLVRVMMVLIKDIVYHCCGHGHGHCSIIVCIFNTFPSVRDETRAWGFHVQHQENSKQSARKTERWVEQRSDLQQMKCNCFAILEKVLRTPFKFDLN